LKVASALHERHRQQLIQYLMLTDLHHGKLINFGGEKVEHEFVNCHETTEHRRSFQVDLSR
jgi:GxxExxY protein